DLRRVLPHDHETSSRDVTHGLHQRFRRMPATTRSTPPTIATQPSKAGTVCDSWTVLWMGPKWTVPWEYKVTPLTSMKTHKPASKIPVIIRSLIRGLRRERKKLPATPRLRNPSPSALRDRTGSPVRDNRAPGFRYSMGLSDRLRTGRTDHLEARSLNVPHQVLLVLRLPGLMLRLFLSLGFRFLFGSAVECALDRHGVPDMPGQPERRALDFVLPATLGGEDEVGVAGALVEASSHREGFRLSGQQSHNHQGRADHQDAPQHSCAFHSGKSHCHLPSQVIGSGQKSSVRPETRRRGKR